MWAIEITSEWALAVHFYFRFRDNALCVKGAHKLQQMGKNIFLSKKFELSSELRYTITVLPPPKWMLVSLELLRCLNCFMKKLSWVSAQSQQQRNSLNRWFTAHFFIIKHWDNINWHETCTRSENNTPYFWMITLTHPDNCFYPVTISLWCRQTSGRSFPAGVGHFSISDFNISIFFFQ